jgi:hypothetical protein
MQDSANELPRTLLPRTWVNKGIKKGQSPLCPGPTYLIAGYCTLISTPRLFSPVVWSNTLTPLRFVASFTA